MQSLVTIILTTILIGLISGTCQVLGYPSSPLVRRGSSVSDLTSQFINAQLLMSYSQMSCEVVFIDSSSAFVAASCLTYKSNGNVDNSVDLKIAMNDPKDGSHKILEIESIDAHPKYDQQTHANNVAVLGFRMGQSIRWNQYIGFDRSGWSTVYYTQRSLSNGKNTDFNTPTVASISNQDESGCEAANNLYSANKNWMLCITQSAQSSENSKCNIPYGAAWGVYPSDIAIGAIYSHSAVSGDTLCGNPISQHHYYTMLQPYTKWAKSKIGRTVRSFAADDNYSYSGSTSFQMNDNVSPNVAGVTVMSGDYYPKQKSWNGPVNPPQPPPPPQPQPQPPNNNNNNQQPSPQPTTDQPNPQPTTQDNNNNNNNDNNDNTTTNNGNNASSNGSSSNTDTSNGGDAIAHHTEADEENSSDSASDGGRGSGGSLGNNNQGGEGGGIGGSHQIGGEGGINDNGQPLNNNGMPGSSSDGEGRDGLSRKAIIAVGVVVPLVSIGIIVGFIFFYRWWRRHRNNNNWDPKSERDNIDRIQIFDQITNFNSTARHTLESSDLSSDPRHSDLPDTPLELPPPSTTRQTTPPSYYEHEFEGLFSPSEKPPQHQQQPPPQ